MPNLWRELAVLLNVAVVLNSLPLFQNHAADLWRSSGSARQWSYSYRILALVLTLVFLVLCKYSVYLMVLEETWDRYSLLLCQYQYMWGYSNIKALLSISIPMNEARNCDDL